VKGKKKKSEFKKKHAKPQPNGTRGPQGKTSVKKKRNEQALEKSNRTGGEKYHPPLGKYLEKCKHATENPDSIYEKSDNLKRGGMQRGGRDPQKGKLQGKDSVSVYFGGKKGSKKRKNAGKVFRVGVPEVL